MNLNQNYSKLQPSYIFAEMNKRVAGYRNSNPSVELIKLGMGDVSLPLVPAVVDAMHQAVSEMGNKDTFQGYTDEQGYLFFRNAVSNYYAKKGIRINSDEVFVTQGAQSEFGNLLDLFGSGNNFLVPDPAYPVYAETGIIAGNQITYVRGTEENDFLPMPDLSVRPDIIYLCSPNNPSGSVYTKEQLKEWVDYALDNKAVIIFDSAYEMYVQDETIPTSILSIDGAKKCAIDVGTLSKTAGFTGMRCGYTIIPKELEYDGFNLNQMYLRRQRGKFKSVAYVVQRGAEAVFSDIGMQQVKSNIDYYMDNARIITEGLRSLGICTVGGENSPYIWFKCPNGTSSWDYFDHLLRTANVIGTPGAGFGKAGEGFFRLSALGDKESVKKAIARITGVEYKEVSVPEKEVKRVNIFSALSEMHNEALTDSNKLMEIIPKLTPYQVQALLHATKSFQDRINAMTRKKQENYGRYFS